MSNIMSFNELPIHCIYLWGTTRHIKLKDAVPNVGMRHQPPNCFNLKTQTYCTMTADHKCKLIKTLDEISYMRPSNK